MKTGRDRLTPPAPADPSASVPPNTTDPADAAVASPRNRTTAGKPVGPAEPVSPGEPSKPARRPKPGDPGEPTGPSEPGEPVNPVERPTSANPTGPGDPDDPTSSGDPAEPPILPRHGIMTRRVRKALAVTEPVKPRRNFGWLVALIVLLLVIGGGYGYDAWTNSQAHSNWQANLTEADTIGWLKIPALGADFAVPIRRGTSQDLLRQGVGWYPGTNGPGQWGNFAVAGYRLGWGQPFAHLADLRPNDTIIVQTADQTYTYTVVTGPITVSSDDTDILSAVPGGPGLTPTRALITLTTARQPLPTRDRTVIIGQLTP